MGRENPRPRAAYGGAAVTQFDDWRALDKLAREYHRRTEEYDRTVCTGPIIRGAIQPMNDRERARINRHALKVSRELRRKAAELGFTRAEFNAAVGRMA